MFTLEVWDLAEKGMGSTPNIVPYKEKRTRGKGLKRTAKQWEETITRHIGKILDNAKPKDLIDAIPMVGCGILGANNFQSLEWGLAGMVGYKLATNEGGSGGVLPNASRAMGLLLLGTIGVKGVWGANPYTGEEMGNVFGDTPGQYIYDAPIWDSESKRFKCKAGWELKIGVGGAICRKVKQ